MARLYQSEYDLISSRRSGQDLNTLIMLLETDGSIEIVDDPTAEEIEKAREKAAKDAEKAQAESEKEAEKAEKEAEKERQAEAEASEQQRLAEQPHPDDTGMDDITENPPEGSEVAQGTDKATTVEDKTEKKGNGRRK